MRELGEIFGVITIVCLLILTARPALMKFNQDMKAKGKTLPEAYMKIFRWITRNHRIIGIAAVSAVLLHLILQVIFVSISLTGSAAAALLASQAGVGLYMSKQKGDSRKKLSGIHRLLGVLVVLAVVVHRLLPYAGIVIK